MAAGAAAATVAAGWPAAARAQPGNDACAQAQRLEVPAEVRGTTVGASPDDAPACGPAVSAPGVWYSVIGTGRTLTAATCGRGTDFDTILTVYCGSCDDLVCAAANDDGCESQSRVSWCSQAGRKYFVFVHGFDGAVGDFELTVTGDGAPCDNPPACQRPAHDACEDAAEAFEQVPYPGDTTAATGDDESSCAAADRIDVWYAWSASCSGLATAELCDSGYDTTLAVFDACGGRERVCNDDACEAKSKVAWPVLQGQRAIIRVSGFDGATGPYVLFISCAPAADGACCLPDGTCQTRGRDACLGGGGEFHPGLPCEQAPCPPPPPPDNDDCENAAQIEVGATPFRTTSANTDGPPHQACREGGADQIEGDVWFLYTAGGDQAVTISTCATADFDTRLAAYAGGACPVDDRRLMACNDDDPDCEGFTSEISFVPECGQTYLVRVGGYESARGSGTLSIVQEGSCIPPVECERISRFTAKCRRGKLSVSVASSLPPDTALTIDNNGDRRTLRINPRGKGKLTYRGQAGEHVVMIVECPEFSRRVDCGNPEP